MDESNQLESWERPIDRKASLHLPALRLDYRPVEERIEDFNEACLGFTMESATIEASRCISCPSPESCRLACPLDNDVPSALWEISRGNLLKAAAIYRDTSNFPECCGRLCPDEALCAGSCPVGKLHPPLRLGRLEAFVADYQRQVEGLPLPAHLPSTGKQVAVIGSGPAGLTCAEQLALLGHSVSIYEMRERPGGMLVYTIPAFRLPAGIVQDKVVQLQRMGVRFVTGTRLGKDFQVADLWRDGNQAIFLASGAGFEPTAQVPGEDLNAVYRATEFLLHLNMEGATRINLSGASVAVFGSGHAAIDCGRAAVRLGASKVTCYLPESEKQATWRVEDQLAAEEEGVEFVPCTRLVKLFGDEQNNLSGLRCQLDLASIPADQRPTGRQPSGLFMVRADLAILAPERGPDPLISGLCPGLEVSPEGWILQDAESGKTSLKGVFAAGDNTGKQHLAAVAIAQARKVAGCIHEYLMEG